MGVESSPRQGKRRVAVSPGDVVAGLATSTVYTSATYPVHRVKVLMQTQDANPHIVSGEMGHNRRSRPHGPDQWPMSVLLPQPVGTYHAWLPTQETATFASRINTQAKSSALRSARCLHVWCRSRA